MSGIAKAARTGQMVMGLILLVSGLIKVWEPVLFYWEAMPFSKLLLGKDLEVLDAATRLALLLGPLECSLGLGLLLNWRPRLVFPAATALMAFFLGLMTYAWRLGATEDCGCFGTLVNRSPGEAAVEDLIMLGMLVFGWWGTRSLPSPALSASARLVAGGTLLALVVAGIRFFPEANRLENSDLQPGVKLVGLPVKGPDLDLMEGDYLVALFSPRCGRCQEEVPFLNKLNARRDLPSLVALSSFPQNSQAMADFKNQLQPHYLIASISMTDFRRLTYKHGYPRLAFVRNGVVRTVWEYFEMPSAEELKEAVGAADGHGEGS